MTKDCCCPRSLTYYQYNESPATEHYEYFHIKNGKPQNPSAISKGKRQPCPGKDSKNNCGNPNTLTFYQYDESPATERYEYFQIQNDDSCPEQVPCPKLEAKPPCCKNEMKKLKQKVRECKCSGK